MATEADDAAEPEPPHRSSRADYVLSMLLRYPEVIPDVVSAAPAGIADVFADAVQAAIWAAFVAMAADDAAYLDLQSVRERVPEAMHASIDALFPLTADQTDWYDGRVIADVNEALRVLAVDHAKERLREVSDLIAAAYDEGDREAVTLYQPEYTRWKDMLKLYPPRSTVFADLQTPRR